MERGLCRALFFEFLFATPASAVLLSGLAVILMPAHFTSENSSYFFLTGFASVGFPLLAFKKVLVGLALKALEQTAEDLKE